MVISSAFCTGSRPHLLQFECTIRRIGLTDEWQQRGANPFHLRMVPEGENRLSIRPFTEGDEALRRRVVLVEADVDTRQTLGETLELIQ